MLTYVKGFMPTGVPVNQVQAYMSMAHGLTPKKVAEYLYEMNQGGIVKILGGLAFINASNFRRLIELIAPDRDPDTGAVKKWDGSDFEQLGLKPKKIKRKKDEGPSIFPPDKTPGGPDV